MSTKTFISVLALASALSFVGPAFAQDHMIDGKAVPADQVQAVQDKCDELRAAGSSDAAGSTEPPAADTAPAAAEAPAEAPATTDATTSTDTAADPPATPDTSAKTMIDLEALTIAMCDEGGFTVSP